jgi:hypothetical protein
MFYMKVEKSNETIYWRCSTIEAITKSEYLKGIKGATDKEAYQLQGNQPKEIKKPKKARKTKDEDQGGPIEPSLLALAQKIKNNRENQQHNTI